MSTQEATASAGAAPERTSQPFKKAVTDSIAETIAELTSDGHVLSEHQIAVIQRTLSRLAFLTGLGLAGQGGSQDDHAVSEIESLKNTLTSIQAQAGFDATVATRGFFQRLTARLITLVVSLSSAA